MRLLMCFPPQNGYISSDEGLLLHRH